jgi:hypothetical protein
MTHQGAQPYTAKVRGIERSSFYVPSVPFALFYPVPRHLLSVCFTRQTALGLGGNDRPARTYFSGYWQYDDTVTEVNLQATGSLSAVMSKGRRRRWRTIVWAGKKEERMEEMEMGGVTTLLTLHRARSVRLILLCW